MADAVIQLGRSTLQHGKLNDRIYLMKLSRADWPGILDRLDALAAERGYSKIFVKAPGYARAGLERAGYRIEAAIPAFYGDGDEGLFAGKFLDPARGVSEEAPAIAEVLQAAQAKAQPASAPKPPRPADGIELRVCEPGDAEAMAQLYAEVFGSYPFPIEEPDYLRRTMASHIVYFGAFERGQPIALASAETDPAGGNVEMTDFATRPAARGRGLAGRLLEQMEAAMASRGLRSAYTIARAVSFGMNIVFARAGYRFAGTLINNTHIAGRFESMNVWHKRLPGP